MLQKSLGTSFVPYNPSEDSPPPKVPALSIPTKCFSMTEDNQAKSYHLLLRVGSHSDRIEEINSSKYKFQLSSIH